MDVDLLTRLEQLETKRRTLNAQFDLTKECDSIEELKKRIIVVSDSVSAIKNDVLRLSYTLDSSCDKLGNIYAALKENSHRFELLSKLSQLNFLCKQIDHEDLSNNKELYDKIVQDFQLIYKPLEKTLSARTDLPYVDYASRLKNLEVEHSKAVESGSGSATTQRFR